MKKIFDEFVEGVSRVVFGKKEEIRLAMACLFAGGHLLIEDTPGIGKTTLAKALSKGLGLKFNRVQCTSDMLPGDIVGVSVFEAKSAGFVFHPGPIFTQVLLADEINRATPKTQSALLEAMEEMQVTVEGRTRPLARPFFVIATQNPFEQAGTFPLPESQLDRFLMRIAIGYPMREAEKRLLLEGDANGRLDSMEAYMSLEQVLDIQERIAEVVVSDALLDYLQDLVEYTRQSRQFHTGLSPRAALALLQGTRSWAFLNGRDYALPEDIQHILPWVAAHRLRSKDSLLPVSNARLQSLMKQVAIK